MSSEQNTLQPALRQLAEVVLANYQPAPCEGCQDQPARPFVIAFGRKTNSSSTTSGNTTTTVTTYDNLTARAVSLCPTCLEAYRTTWLGKLRNWLVGAIAFSLICLALVIFGDETAQTFGGGFGVIGVISSLILYVQLRAIRTDDNKVGQRLALSLHQGALQVQGYDAFWTDEVA